MLRAVSKLTLHHMGRRSTLQNWRHIAVAISKKLIRDRAVKRAGFEMTMMNSEQYEIPDDLAVSHTTKTAENYGVSIDLLKRLTAESLEIFGKVSIQ